MRPRRMTDAELARYIVDTAHRTASGCLERRNSVSSNGYPIVCLYNNGEKRHRTAASIVVEQFVIKRPLRFGRAECVRHRCDNPLCVEPEHLTTGTSKENTEDMLRRNRGHFSFQENSSFPGEMNGNAKLTEDYVREIRDARAAGEKLEPLAKRFGVTKTLISAVCRRKAWAHVA